MGSVLSLGNVTSREVDTSRGSAMHVLGNTMSRVNSTHGKEYLHE